MRLVVVVEGHHVMALVGAGERVEGVAVRAGPQLVQEAVLLGQVPVLLRLEAQAEPGRQGHHGLPALLGAEIAEDRQDDDQRNNTDDNQGSMSTPADSSFRIHRSRQAEFRCRPAGAIVAHSAGELQQALRRHKSRWQSPYHGRIPAGRGLARLLRPAVSAQVDAPSVGLRAPWRSSSGDRRRRCTGW